MTKHHKRESVKSIGSYTPWCTLIVQQLGPVLSQHPLIPDGPRMFPDVPRYVGICGQGPSDHPDLAKWLMEQGIDSVSLNPDSAARTTGHPELHGLWGTARVDDVDFQWVFFMMFIGF